MYPTKSIHISLSTETREDGQCSGNVAMIKKVKNSMKNPSPDDMKNSVKQN